MCFADLPPTDEWLRKLLELQSGSSRSERKHEEVPSSKSVTIRLEQI